MHADFQWHPCVRDGEATASAEFHLSVHIDTPLMGGLPAAPAWGSCAAPSTPDAAQNCTYAGADARGFLVPGPPETALELEADRMRNLRLDASEFDSEKAVVLEELAMGRDNPWRRLSHEVGEALYGRHPYGRPIIGYRDSLEPMGVDLMRSWYERTYHPGRATLVLCGGLQPRKALAAVRAHFGDLPAGPERRPLASAPLREPEGERPAGDAEPLPASAEDRVSAVEQDVSGLKEGMKNIMSTLFNIQEQLKANPGAGAGAAAGGAVAAAKTEAESTQDSVARIIADAKAARAAVDAAKSSSDAKKKANAKANAKAKKPKRAASGDDAAGEDDAASEDAAKAPPIETPEEKKADEALKAPVAEGDLESYEAQMMGPGNAQ